MPDIKAKVIKNSVNKACGFCGGIHDFVSRMPETGYRDCATPVAFSNEKALKLIRLLGASEDDVIDAPHDTFVIMDDSARKLPRGQEVHLAQIVEREILA